MRTKVPERLLKIADDIAERGNVPLTRLTVMKKWFEQRPPRMHAFALWLGRRAIAQKGKTAGNAAKLFREAKSLLGAKSKPRQVIPGGTARDALHDLHARLYDFQNKYRHTEWADVREINNWNLFLVERTIEILLDSYPNPADSYRLAAQYCQHYDPRYGNGLNGPSQTKIMDIARWMGTAEALEDDAGDR